MLEPTGNTFVAVTDERGFYRMPVRVGTYRLIAELQGFATVERPAVQILTGQTTAIRVPRHHWQASATYTLSGFWNAIGAPFMGVPGTTPIEVPFALAQDLKGEWSLADGDQRHRLVLNGIWQVGRGFQLSAIHYAISLPTRVSVDVMAEA